MTQPVSLSRRWLAALLVGGALAGCTSLPPASPTRQTAQAPAFLVHVSASESREIHAFFMDAKSGNLESLEVVAVPGTGAPTRGNLPLAWDRDQKVLYAQHRIAPFPLTSYTVDPKSGKLRPKQTVDLSAPMAALAVTSDGRQLMSVSYDNALVMVNRLDGDGRVTLPALQSLPTAPKTHHIVEAPFGNFVYATTLDGNSVLVYRRDAATGLLQLASSTQTRAGAGPRHLVFHPTLDMLYSVNEYAGSVTAYGVDRHTGAVREVQYEAMVPAGFQGSAAGADIHVTPNGRFLYASVRRTHELTKFEIDPATGRLSKRATFKVEHFPRGFNIDPTGKFLLCAGQESNHVGVYAIDQVTGDLSLLKRYPAGKRPGWIEFKPWYASARP